MGASTHPRRFSAVAHGFRFPARGALRADEFTGGEHTGTDCGSGAPLSSGCDPAYPTVCIPPPPDLNCGNIPHKRFRVNGADPHRFDGDRDGVGCEN
jgi:hypothetical protein